MTQHPPSNMALQRTRGLVAVSPVQGSGTGRAAQNLSGGRSPLNAVALGRLRRHEFRTQQFCRSIQGGR
jgi:hypothetical protein